MSANATPTPAPVILVCRAPGGREISRQTFTDPAQADRVMIARNRAELNAWRCNPDAAPLWGIETVTECAEEGASK